MDDEATWLEAVSILTLWIAAVLLVAFLVRCIWEAKDADAAVPPGTVCAELPGMSVHIGYQFGPKCDLPPVEAVSIPEPPAQGITPPTIGDQLCPQDVCPGGLPLLR